MLQYSDRGAFVAAVLADIPETPPYFERMKQVNRAGPVPLRAGRLPSIRPAAAAALSADGALVVDLRSGEAFAAGHPYGALNIAFGPKVGYWAGWVVPPDVPLLLLADDASQAQEAFVQLLRVGLDRVEGTIAGFDGWIGAGLPVARIERISAAELRAAVQRMEPLRILDVRSRPEWCAGHLDGAINIPVGELPVRMHELEGDWPIATICEGGYRSTLAASLLAHEGFPRLVNVVGGMTAYRAPENSETT
jgi:hydroxyacylglutathione hydrolase